MSLHKLFIMYGKIVGGKIKQPLPNLILHKDFKRKTLHLERNQNYSSKISAKETTSVNAVNSVYRSTLPKVYERRRRHNGGSAT